LYSCVPNRVLREWFESYIIILFVCDTTVTDNCIMTIHERSALKLSNFGERLKTLRNDQNLSQGQLAEASKISVNYLRHIEKSRRVPNIDLLVVFCNLFDVSPAFLLQDALSIKKTNDDTQEVLRVLDKLSPDKLSYVRDVCGVVEKHFTATTK